MATAQELSQLAATLAKLADTIAERETAPPEQPAPKPTPERIMLTAEEAAERLGIGRTLIYRLIRHGEIESVRIGRLRRIPATAVHDYATRLINGTATTHAA
ncbi:helix-turn-helix domain-containing protein [Prauserella muralis]|uniref:Excisionase n=1 Tax=Prauserella muralis TaxID=588067 RepID=A0A2V4B6V2_9PSEU|nr:helix-turn-helix domain-containing protein [Prauserella muralis]PXY31115.1 excisionase [Prauserella muralis]TWE14594.1 excisionase family DNA binding protein [Prauserella muralis]